MVEKIDAEIKKLLEEKLALENNDTSYIEDQVAKYREQLLEQYNAEKDEKIKAIDFKVGVLQDWKEEELLKQLPIEEIEIAQKDVEQVEPVVEEASTQPQTPIVY